MDSPNSNQAINGAVGGTRYIRLVSIAAPLNQSKNKELPPM
jgi:hypothetical protein